MPGVNLKNLDLNLLVVFEAIYTAGNITHAADQLAMSQPAVSNALARLRDLIGDPLFVRAKRGVEPTSKAKDMIGAVRDALGLIKRQLDGSGELDFATYKRRFRILMIDALEPILMPPVLKIMIEKAPGIQIESISGYRVDFVDAIKTGTLDLAFFVYPVNEPDIVVVPMCPVDVVFVARRGHPKIGKTLDLETFKSLRQIALVPEMRSLSNVDSDLAAHQAPRNIAYMVNRFWSMPPIIERSDLVGPMPRRFAEEVAKNFDVAIYDPPVKMSDQYLYITWHAKNEHDAGHRWLRETFLATVAQAEALPSNVTRSNARGKAPSAADS
jgi:DNA-binding transcriptional LysR family regulator